MNVHELDQQRQQDARKQINDALEAIELARQFPVAGGPVPIKETHWGMTTRHSLRPDRR